MKLKLKEVIHVANLAKLILGKEEEKKLNHQLSETITYIEKLNEIDTSACQPTSQVTGLENIDREDKVTPSITQDEALGGAKNKYHGYFKVKAILNKT